MEKLTISRVGQPKTINFTNKRTQKPDSFQKVGFQTNEYPERWFDLAFRGNVPLVVGTSYEFEITEREYNGKTYYDAKLPRTESRGAGTNPELIRKLDQIITELAILKPMIRDIHSWKTSEGKPMPFEDDPLEGVF